MKTIQELLINLEYAACILWINNARSNLKTWSDIDFACKNDENGLKKFLKDKEEDDFWTIQPEEWHLLVARMKEVEQKGDSGFIGYPKKTLVTVPTQDGSCWVKYKSKLESTFTYESIRSIEKSTQKIISQLSSKTDVDDPVRGMVVGNVQSGKTANMAGVIAMAADYGFNFFIILTGTIDNLREQTRERLIRDLNHENCNLTFNNLDYLSPRTSYPNRLQDLYLSEDSNKRYLAVCLKNSTRLKNLLNWLNTSTQHKEKLKILMIDDEADQAGVNTKNVESSEQTAISKYIKNIVFGRDARGENCSPYQCMNYIGYTATPYANLLNESGNKTLYPKNFITVLNTPDEYLGPQEIYGIDGVNEGLNIVNIIPEDDIWYIENEVEFLKGELPESLEQALLWYICTVSIFRLRKIEKPVSMLIHTSHKIEKHEIVEMGIENYFGKKPMKEMLVKIEKVYNEQIERLSLDDFKTIRSNYNQVDLIKDYPEFDELIPFLKELLKIGITHIKLGDNDTLTYNKGIHLCVDNCRQNQSNYEFQMRIVYPDKTDLIMKESPAFIIIGGATLSRGLTLDGLTASYFLRTSTTQADTLMQMGRWFGYRKDYEMLPRIWLSKKTMGQFNRLTRLDYDLRNEIYTMELKGLSPTQYGPRLDCFPDYKLLVLTSKRKMQSSIEYQCTFYNKSAQTTWFYKDDEIVEKNYDNTLGFLNSLGDIDKDKIDSLKNDYTSDNPLMWFDVDYNKVLTYLSSLNIPQQAATFLDYEGLKKWYKKQYELGYIKNFTVIAGGVKHRINNDVQLDNGLTIHLQNRLRIEWQGPAAKDYTKFIDLNSITQPDDRLMDIDFSRLSPYQIEELKGMRYKDQRIKYASSKEPLLIVYIIDKDSGKNKDVEYNSHKSRNKLPLSTLGLPTHIVGYYIYIPYGKFDTDSNKVTIKLKYDDIEGEVDVNEDEN